MKTTITGAEVVLRVLESQGVDCIFGYPGGTMLPLYDRLYQSKITHHLVRHEQGAVHMADAYARATGKVGIVFVTSGPGATNTVTGLVNAKLDSAPVLVITAQVPSALIGTDGFQEADVVGITIAATKHNDLIRDVENLEKAVLDALYIAKEGRPGPVLLDIPKDVLNCEVDYPKYQIKPLEFKKEIVKGDFDDAARALCEAVRPVCYFGGGVINADASEELREIVSLLNLPSTGTLMGLGAISGNDPRFIGMPGMHGTYTANMAIHNSDLLFSVGVRFDDRVTGKTSVFAPGAKIIHIDIDESEISKIKKADWGLIGDAKPVIKKLTSKVKQYLKEKHPGRDKTINSWWKSINKWQKDQPLRFSKSTKTIKPQELISEVYQQTKGDLIVATDVGQHQMWVAQYFPITYPRELMTSGGLGTMGFGLPAAIGAQVGRPDKQVVAFVGDGSFQMNIQEMAMLIDDNVPVKVIILNNSSLGMVRQWQDMFYEQRFMATDISVAPDFVKVAKAYGVESLRIDDPSQLKSGIKTMLDHKGAFLLDAIVDKDEHVYPMVPAGKASKDMLLQK
ncbi:biosynthetic-type acetolactate synthase large subunit [Candidatus Margulisiibacteriota bacterium]